MLKRLLIPVLLVAMAAGPALAQEKDARSAGFDDALKAALPKTVMIRSELADGKGECSGSGAVISAEGHILTCSHVIVNREKLKVITPGGRTYGAKLLGQNFLNDFALIKIEARNCAFFELGESGKLKAGEPVMGLGFPGGQSRDGLAYVAYGKVLALGRNVPVQGFQRYYKGAIKSDMKSVPGNSGGPLVTRDGKLVGLNGAVMIFLDRTYSIPVDSIKKALPTLRKGRDVEGEGAEDFGHFLKDLERELSPDELKKFWEEAKRQLGELDASKLLDKLRNMFDDEIDIEKLQEELKRLLGDAQGELSELLKELLGEDGLEELQKELEKLFGDKETMEELAKEFEKQLEELERLLGGEEKEKDEKEEKRKPGELPEGEELDREIDRLLEELKRRFGEEDEEEGEKGEEDEEDSIRKKLEKMLDELLGEEKKEKGEKQQEKKEKKVENRKEEKEVEEADEKKPYLGIRVSEASEALRYQLDLEGGLVIDEINEDSPAAKSGLHPGDVIVEGDGRRIVGFEELVEVLEGKSPGDSVKLTVVTKGRKRAVEVELGSK